MIRMPLDASAFYAVDCHVLCLMLPPLFDADIFPLSMPPRHSSPPDYAFYYAAAIERYAAAAFSLTMPQMPMPCADIAAIDAASYADAAIFAAAVYDFDTLTLRFTMLLMRISSIFYAAYTISAAIATYFRHASLPDTRELPLRATRCRCRRAAAIH